MLFMPFASTDFSSAQIHRLYLNGQILLNTCLCFDKGRGITLDEDDYHWEQDMVQEAVSLTLQCEENSHNYLVFWLLI